MENIDRQILSLLAADGRMSYTEIGKQTGLSTSAAQQRVRRLEHRGIIEGYSARISYHHLGLALSAFVEVTPLDNREPDDIPERLQAVPEVVSCYSVAGQANYILRVRVQTPLQLENVLSAIRTTGGVSTQTTIVLSVPYEDRHIDPPEPDSAG